LNLLGFIPSPTWRDLIDILFLTIVAYQLYAWFRGTRALRVLIGLVGLGGVYSLAKLWGLFLTTWAFQILWQVLVILLLILFQSEIRQVLEKVSPLRYLRSRRRGPQTALVKELTELVFELARERTGALIVIARDHNPSEFIHGGHTIMALPDPMLIKVIFNRHTPAHDGAIVISGGHIIQMSCILPLTEREDIPKYYGTRHRAALGLSERTDALCVVVSEERSEVSLAVGEKITICENPKILASRLGELLSVSDIPWPTLTGFLRGAFLQNWRPKLAALMLVIMAWLVLASQQEGKINVTAPIRYVNLTSELVLGEGSAQTVRLTLSGRRHSMKVLNTKGVQVQVDLMDVTEGTHVIKLSPRNVEVPLGVMIDQVTPQNIKAILRPSESPPPDAKGEP
jgi:diadenylate cyclase